MTKYVRQYIIVIKQPLNRISRKSSGIVEALRIENANVLERNIVDMGKNFDTFFDKLKRVGVNTDKTIDRFGGLDELYVKFLVEFSNTERFEEIYSAIETGDSAKAEMCAHKLKGVLGNLGMDELFAEAELVMKDLRSGNTAQAEQRLRTMQPKVIEIQQAIKETPHD